MGLQQPMTDEADFLDSFMARQPVAFSAMPGVSVYVFSVEKSLSRIADLATLLSDSEAARAEQISHANRRSAYVASRGADEQAARRAQLSSDITKPPWQRATQAQREHATPDEARQLYYEPFDEEGAALMLYFELAPHTQPTRALPSRAKDSATAK